MWTACTGTIIIAALAGGLVACGDGVAPARVANLAISPPAIDLVQESTLQLAATVMDAAGTVLEDRGVIWTSENSGVAEVSSSGLVTGVEPGQTRIAASAEGIGALATVTVLPRPVASIVVSPELAELLVGDTRQFSATPLASDGSPLEERPVTWTSTPVSVATVSELGLVRAMAPGTAIITASSEGKKAIALVDVAPVPIATITVTPASPQIVVGEAVQLAATARAADGSELTGRTIAWATDDNPVIAAVNSTGRVSGIRPGIGTITASAEGRSGSVAVTVVPMPVEAVRIDPTSADLILGETKKFAATAHGKDGVVLTDRPVTWSSNNPAVLTVDGSGLALAVRVGHARVTATSEGKSASAEVEVSPKPVARILIDPGTADLMVGAKQQFTARTEASDGSELTDRPVTWKTSAAAVATVDSNGLVTAVGRGNATVTATSEGKDGTVDVTVRLPPAVIVITGGNAQTDSGDGALREPLVVRVLDAEGQRVHDVRVSWTTALSTDAVNPASVLTNAQGEAATSWTLGPGPSGLRRAWATVDGLAPVEFVAIKLR